MASKDTDNKAIDQLLENLTHDKKKASDLVKPAQNSPLSNQRPANIITNQTNNPGFTQATQNYPTTQFQTMPTQYQTSVLPQRQQQYVQQPLQNLGVQNLGVQNYGVQNLGVSGISNASQASSQYQTQKGESWFEQVPYERVYTEYVEKKVVEYVAVERKVTDYYTVENQIEYIPQVQYETIVEYVPVERVEERVEYQEMRRSLMHQQPIEQQQTIVQTVQAPVQQYVQQSYVQPQVQQQVVYTQPQVQQQVYTQPQVQQQVYTQPQVQQQVYTQPQVQSQVYTQPQVQQQAYTQQLPRQSNVQQLVSNSPSRLGNRNQLGGQFQDPNIKMTNSISLSKNKKL